MFVAGQGHTCRGVPGVRPPNALLLTPPASGPSYYPQLLMLDRPRDIDPVLRLLERLECRGDNLRLLVWEYPRCVAGAKGGGPGGGGSTTCVLDVLPGCNSVPALQTPPVRSGPHPCQR